MSHRGRSSSGRVYKPAGTFRRIQRAERVAGRDVRITSTGQIIYISPEGVETTTPPSAPQPITPSITPTPAPTKTEIALGMSLPKELRFLSPAEVRAGQSLLPSARKGIPPSAPVSRAEAIRLLGGVPELTPEIKKVAPAPSRVSLREGFELGKERLKGIPSRTKELFKREKPLFSFKERAGRFIETGKEIGIGPAVSEFVTGRRDVTPGAAVARLITRQVEPGRQFRGREFERLTAEEKAFLGAQRVAKGALFTVPIVGPTIFGAELISGAGAGGLARPIEPVRGEPEVFRTGLELGGIAGGLGIAKAAPKLISLAPKVIEKISTPTTDIRFISEQLPLKFRTVEGGPTLRQIETKAVAVTKREVKIPGLGKVTVPGTKQEFGISLEALTKRARLEEGKRVQLEVGRAIAQRVERVSKKDLTIIPTKEKPQEFKFIGLTKKEEKAALGLGIVKGEEGLAPSIIKSFKAAKIITPTLRQEFITFKGGVGKPPKLIEEFVRGRGLFISPKKIPEAERGGIQVQRLKFKGPREPRLVSEMLAQVAKELPKPAVKPIRVTKPKFPAKKIIPTAREAPSPFAGRGQYELQEFEQARAPPQAQVIQRLQIPQAQLQPLQPKLREREKFKEAQKLIPQQRARIAIAERERVRAGVRQKLIPVVGEKLRVGEKVREKIIEVPREKLILKEPTKLFPSFAPRVPGVPRVPRVLKIPAPPFIPFFELPGGGGIGGLIGRRGRRGRGRYSPSLIGAAYPKRFKPITAKRAEVFRATGLEVRPVVKGGRF